MAKTTLICEQCGEAFTVTASAQPEPRFCSVECEDAYAADGRPRGF